MASIRQKQVSETVKRHFGFMLQQEGANFYGDKALVTVTTVDMSPDLTQAIIYLSVYNVENKQEVILELQNSYGALRQSLGNRLKSHLRKIPALDIRLDDTLDEMARLNEVFDRLEENDQIGKKDEEE